jgi:hypothetical protein
MQDGLMALVGEVQADHQTEAVGRTCNEDARHSIPPTLRSAIDIDRLCRAAFCRRTIAFLGRATNPVVYEVILRTTGTIARE